jgi:hypothetical protein
MKLNDCSITNKQPSGILFVSNHSVFMFTWGLSGKCIAAPYRKVVEGQCMEILNNPSRNSTTCSWGVCREHLRSIFPGVARLYTCTRRKSMPGDMHRGVIALVYGSALLPASVLQCHFHLALHYCSHGVLAYFQVAFRSSLLGDIIVVGTISVIYITLLSALCQTTFGWLWTCTGLRVCLCLYLAGCRCFKAHPYSVTGIQCEFGAGCLKKLTCSSGTQSVVGWFGLYSPTCKTTCVAFGPSAGRSGLECDYRHGDSSHPHDSPQGLVVDKRVTMRSLMGDDISSSVGESKFESDWHFFVERRVE